MKNYLKHILVLTLWMLGPYAFSQISPGDLIQGHADIEGVFNCTKCHDLGEKVSNNKCLDCHEIIADLMEQQRGYHASEEVTQKDCFECHSDHHGRNFNSTLFDTLNFDHALTGYDLVDAHADINCVDCHNRDFIENIELLEKEQTYLGLNQSCLTCHNDYHQGSLGEDCASCHNMIDFSDPVYFDHQETDYPLKGAHQDVECVACHEMTIKNGLDYQVYTDIEHHDCVVCHENKHQEELDQYCSTCHTTTSFGDFVGSTYFNHSNTDFELKGKHSQVGCFICHEPDLDPFIILLDQRGVQQNQCVSCHEDVHEQKLGTDCVSCHNEQSFKEYQGEFDHNKTDYMLEGKHQDVDCAKCHTSDSYLDEIEFANCSSCHDDFHDGIMLEYDKERDCAACHSEEGFDLSLYTIDDHNNSVFKLEGAHLATPCIACHLKSETWEFRNIGSSCVDCHEDVHARQFEKNNMVKCSSCHSSNSWNITNFNHDSTNFPLDGKHAEVDCSACHKEGLFNDQEVIIYKIPSYQCSDCHSY